MAKDTYYFSHDYNARRDPKIIEMVFDYKATGYGLFWATIEMMAEQDGYKLKKDVRTCKAIAMEMQCERITVDKWIDDCISIYELFLTDGEYFWSNSLLNRMKLKEAKSEKARKSAQARWQKTAENQQNEDKENSESNANALKTHNERNAEVSECNAIKGNESKGNEIKEKKDIYINIPCEDILQAYNEICCSLPKVKSLSEKRKNKIKSRWKELKELNKFKDVFTKAENSSFLTGNNKSNWKCSFDWLMENDNNYVKVLEGQYDNNRNNSTNNWLQEE